MHLFILLNSEATETLKYTRFVWNEVNAIFEKALVYPFSFLFMLEVADSLIH